MKTKKPLLMAGVGTVVGLAAFAGVASAQAPSGGNDGQSSLVSKIATKFNLKESDVQAVFDEDRTSHEADRQAKMEERLTQAVTDGKITEDQKTAILDKMDEMKTYMDSIKDKTDAEKHELMKAKMNELKQWAQDNNLTDYLPMAGHRGPGAVNIMFKDDGSAGTQKVSSDTSNN